MKIDLKNTKFPPLGLDEYQIKAYATEQPHDNAMPTLAFPLLGLFGETGTLLSALKKNQRDGQSYVGYQEAVIEELGDALWYLSDIASKKSIKLSQLAQIIYGARSVRFGKATPKVWRFADLELKGGRHTSLESKAFEVAVIELASSVGLLVNDFKLKRIDGNRDLLTNHLVKIFQSMIRVADRPEIDLNTVAAFNLHKIQGRWPKKKIFPPLFDAKCEPWERLPRKMKMTILEKRWRTGLCRSTA